MTRFYVPGQHPLMSYKPETEKVSKQRNSNVKKYAEAMSKAYAPKEHESAHWGKGEGNKGGDVR